MSMDDGSPSSCELTEWYTTGYFTVCGGGGEVESKVRYVMLFTTQSREKKKNGEEKKKERKRKRKIKKGK